MKRTLSIGLLSLLVACQGGALDGAVSDDAAALDEVRDDVLTVADSTSADDATTTIDDAPSESAPSPHDGAPIEVADVADASPGPPSRGAALPYDEYEAEDAVVHGAVIGPSRAFGELAAESSGRRAVRLEVTGDSVSFTTKRASNSIVVRYSIPDAPGGGGIDATLALYVDGVHRKDLALTSRYAWIYGAFPSANDPHLGGAHHFFDEARALLPEIPAGAKVELRKEAGNTAPWYVIDLIDLEEVAPPLARPTDALSIVDYGAIEGDGKDDAPAIVKCVAAARASGKTVWIPPGTFEDSSAAIDVAEVTIAGAGMWHSTLHGLFARFRCTGNDCRYRDFSILGETVVRDDASQESGFLGGAGTGSRLDGVWVEHTKTGYWVGPTSTEGLVIHGCRFRDLFADGVNLCNGASHSIVEESHARNTGDDAFASWSPSSEGGVNTENVFRHDTVQLPWLANCFAIYGGRDNRIEDGTCADVVQYPGVLLSQQFGSHPFAGTTTVQRVTLTRAGGPAYGREQGALKLQAFDAPMAGFRIADVDIVDATFSGLHVQGPQAIDGLVLDGVRIDGAGSYGVFLDGDAHGGANASNVIVRATSAGGLRDATGGKFVITRGAGNVGW